MKNILVFGGYGFLGHYLVQELLKRNYKVTIADISKKDDFGDYATFVQCNILNRDDVLNVFQIEVFDIGTFTKVECQSVSSIDVHVN